MEINNVKINGFGNLENKNIQFKNGINLILGNNENGKSTLLKFISSMFYGIPKNKSLEEVRPWYSNDFSGKIEYTLDNGEKYFVFRDFANKKIQILNDNYEDVTSNYGMDKARGSLFFMEQTGVNEDLFRSTYLLEQGQSKLDKNRESMLIHSVTNILSTGDNNISYKNTVDKLNQKLIEDVGTDRSSGRPINVLDEKIERLTLEKQELADVYIEQEKLNKEKMHLENNIKSEEDRLKLLKQVKVYIEKKQLEIEKLKLDKNKRC